MTTSTSKLFQPIKVGNMDLRNRVVMAPLTRHRATDEHVPLSGIVSRYYSDRASYPGTLIISEATSISPAEEAQHNLPGISTPDEMAAWKPVYDAVHARGSFLFQQLWAMGRAAEPEHVIGRGFKYTSSSAVALEGSDVVPEALTEEEILEKIADFARSARNAVEAGADGVEIHGAHGYLIEQFIKDSVNRRTDRWGGSVENRARFLLEVVKAVVDAIGAERVGIRLSPFATYLNSVSSDPVPQYLYIVRELKKAGYNLAYLSLVEPRESPASVGSVDVPQDPAQSLDFLLEEWGNRSLVVVAGGYLPDTAQWAVDQRYKKWNVAVAFGRHFLANPDLVYRIKHGLVLNKYNRATFYTPKVEVGYNDYPFSEEYKASATAVAA